MSSKSGKTSSHSNLLEALKKLNFRETSGLLCFLETEKIDNGHSKDTSIKKDAEPVNGNTNVAEEKSNVNLVSKVKNTVGRNRAIANKCKVFVGNIGYKVKRRELREFFNSFGRVLSAEIIQDRIKRKSRGFGFVTFSNEWEAQKAKNSTDDERMLHYRVMVVTTPTRKRKGAGREPHEKEQSLEDVLEEFKQLSNNIQDNKTTDNLESSTEEEENVLATLNDDMFIYIFTFLELKDRIRIERVCKRWQTLVLKSWCMITHLDFKDIFSLYKGGLTDYILLRIFQRGCKNLKSLDVSASPFLLTEYSIKCIGRFCKGLTKIDLSGVQLSTSSLKTLSKSCTKLEVVTLKRCTNAGEKGLWWLFKECRNLKHINLSGIILLTGKCFFMLPSNVESLNLSDCSRLTNTGAAFIGNLCCNLQSIDLSGCATLSDAAIIHLLDCSQIKKFYFKNCPQTVTNNSLEMMISRLTHLTVLDLSRCHALNDDLLIHIGRNCTNLTCLHIQECPNDLTDTGVESLATCDKLQQLDISYNDKITSASISQISANGSLQKLIARGCDGITDQVVKSLGNNCENLTEVDLSGCTYITDESLDYMINSYKSSTDRCSLTLVIGGTSITEEAVTRARKECDRIEIITHDFSSEYSKLRNQRNIMPQFFDDSDDEDDNVYDDSDEIVIGADNYPDEYEDFLLADDPSMMDEHEWMFN